MPACIRHISTAVPETAYTQDFIRDFMKTHVATDRMQSMIIHRIYGQSGIQKRYSVLCEFGNDPDRTGLFIDPETGNLQSPSTGKRNEVYIREARQLYIRAARKVFEERPDLDPASVTHVITVSCTGFYAPGPDIDVVNALNLPGSTQRYHIGFMGCYAALPALRMAKSIIGDRKDAVVLIVSVELCTLHLNFESDLDALLSTTVFADGAAAALVTDDADLIAGSGSGSGGAAVDMVASVNEAASSHTDETASASISGLVNPGIALRIDGLYSDLASEGASDMAWTIGDNGFDMVLSSYIPDIIESNLDDILAPIWQQSGRTPDTIDLWAVHPGGRAIVDKIQQSLGLSEEQLSASRNTLRDFGNMSSATVLFVLRDLMEAASARATGESGPAAVSVIAMAFGPGLTVETALLEILQK